MNHIVDQIEAVVESMQDLNGSPYFMFGHRVEINQLLLKKDKSPTEKDKKYPLIAMRWETDGLVKNGLIEYNINLVFVNYTKKEYDSEQRKTLVIQGILEPIYENFWVHLKNSGLFQWDGDQKIPLHRRFDRPYWGTYEKNGNIANIFSDPLDGIEVVDLIIKGRAYDGCEARIPIENRVTVNINDVEMAKFRPYSTANLEVVNTEGTQVGEKLSNSEWGIPDINIKVGEMDTQSYPYTSETIIIDDSCLTLTELWDASTIEEKVVLYLGLDDSERIELQSALPDEGLLALYEALPQERRLYLYQQITDAQRSYLFNNIDDDERLYLFVNLPDQDQKDLYDELTDAQRIVLQSVLTDAKLFALYDALTTPQRITLFNSLSSPKQQDLYNGLTDVLRKSLFDQLTDAQKDYITPFHYNYPIPSGQLTEFLQYDDRWQEVNILAPKRALVPKYSRRPRLVDFYTLAENNIHGNTRRFTLENGNEPALATGGQLLQCHYTGFDFLTGGSNSGTVRNFADTLTYIDGLSLLGYSDYYWAGWKILTSYYDENNPSGLINKYDSASVAYSSTSILTKHRGLRAADGTDVVNSATYHRGKTSTSTQALIYRVR